MTPTLNPMPEALRQRTTVRLQAQLSTLMGLAALAWTAHWNVRGANYEGLHRRFGKLVDDAHAAIDRVAEMSRQLGGEPVAVVTSQPTLATSPQLYVSIVAVALARVLAGLRSDIADAVDPLAQNLLIEIASTMQTHLAHVEASRD